MLTPTATRIEQHTNAEINNRFEAGLGENASRCRHGASAAPWSGSQAQAASR